MKVAFLITRNIYFRSFGSIIDEFLKRGHQVFCFYDYSQPKKGSKGYQFPDISQTPKFRNGQVVCVDFLGEEDLLNKVLKNNIQVVVSLDFAKWHIDLRTKLKKEGIFWVALQRAFDVGKDIEEYLYFPDKLFVFSNNYLPAVFKYLKEKGKAQQDNFVDFEKALQNKIKAIGLYFIDQEKSISPNQVRQEWGIPQDKKVVAIFPFPFGSSQKKFWAQKVYGLNNRFLQIILAYLYNRRNFLKQILAKENDFEICKALRKFCDNNNCFLIVKARKKDPAKRYLAKMADKVLFDEEIYPATTIKCLVVADLFFNFYSTGTFEGVALGKPVVCVAPREQDWEDIQDPRFKAVLEGGNLFDWPGVSYLKTIPEIINNLPKKKLIDFPFIESEKEKYLKNFVAGDMDSASLDIVLEVERMLEKE